MERRFCLRQVPFQPNTQLIAELGRGFTCEPFTLAEEIDPALKFGPSVRGLFQLGDGRQQLRQLSLDQFCFVQRLVLSPVLERILVVFPICFTRPIQIPSPYMARRISFRPS